MKADTLDVAVPFCMFVSKNNESCTALANEFTFNTSTRKYDWATCEKHKAFVRPYVEMHGKKRSANESALYAIIAARLSFRLALTRLKTSQVLISELADDVIDAVFTGPNRTVAKYLIHELEEGEK